MAIGRPKKEFDWEEFEKLCQMQCTLGEIAGWFGVSDDIVEKRCKEKYDLPFTEVFKQKRAGGRISLRRKQYQAALGGNTALLIWLGKQYLGQVDKAEFSSAADKPFVLKYMVEKLDEETENKADE